MNAVETQATNGGQKERMLDLSVVIVSWNTCDLLRRCLQLLSEQITDLRAEVFVVDNASADGSAKMVAAEFPHVKLIENRDNLGFARANNQVLKCAGGKSILLLNPDTEVKPHAIATLLAFLDSHPAAGVVAPQLLNTDGTVQRSCREFPTVMGMFYELVGLSRMFPQRREFRRYKMLDFGHAEERQVDQPEGACLLVRREVIEQVGLLDEGYFMLFEEVDWCYRIKKAGWQVWFTPSAKVLHHYGQSIKQVKARMILSSHKGMYRFWRKHYAGGFFWLAPIAFSALMALAVMRILSYQLRQMLTGDGHRRMA
jgi:GT2 family glycosyltransferase